MGGWREGPGTWLAASPTGRPWASLQALLVGASSPLPKLQCGDPPAPFPLQNSLLPKTFSLKTEVQDLSGNS